MYIWKTCLNFLKYLLTFTAYIKSLSFIMFLFLFPYCHSFILKFILYIPCIAVCTSVKHLQTLWVLGGK